MYIDKLRYIFFISLIPFTSYAKGLDISDISPSSSRSYLKPILSALVVEQESPLFFLPSSEKPSIKLGSKFISLSNSDRLGFDPGFPAFYGSIAISPNISIGGEIFAFNWQYDNVHSIGPFFTTSWGTENKSNVFAVSVFHLYGPDDFHYHNLNLTYSRHYNVDKWDFALGLTSHLITCKIHVKDNVDTSQNYSKIEEFQFNHLKGAAYRKISKNFTIGFDMDISSYIIAIGFSIIANI